MVPSSDAKAHASPDAVSVGGTEFFSDPNADVVQSEPQSVVSSILHAHAGSLDVPPDLSTDKHSYPCADV